MATPPQDDPDEEWELTPEQCQARVDARRAAFRLLADRYPADAVDLYTTAIFEGFAEILKLLTRQGEPLPASGMAAIESLNQQLAPTGYQLIYRGRAN